MEKQQQIGPVWVTEFDVAAPPARLLAPAATANGARYERARVLVRCQTEPLGMVTVALGDGDYGEIDVASLEADCRRRFGSAIGKVASFETVDSAEVVGQALSPELRQVASGPVPAVSVVIGTRNRPDHIVECVDRLLKQDYPAPFEVLIVDNGADNTATADAVTVNYGNDERVRYLAESRPGLSRARNIGLAAAKFSVTAFLSDDIQVEPWWLLTLARGFARHGDVKAVTGICPPLYLETPEQLNFEALMAWGTRQGFEPERYRLTSTSDRLHPYRPGSFANGSNMAFDTAYFRSVGGFDERLGPGTTARGGEDLDAPLQVLYNGGLIAFEPAAVGWHADRYDDRPFESHLYTYGLGLTAFLTKHLLDSRSRWTLLKRLPFGLGLMLDRANPIDNELHPDLELSRRHRLAHLRGRLMGPIAYARTWKGV